MEEDALEISAATSDFILRHADDDVRELALRPVPADVDLRAALQQIEGRQLAARKMTFCMGIKGFLYPPRLSLEQCSSEQTASYKRKVLERLLAGLQAQYGQLHDTFFCDLTGGFGIDFMTLAPLFDHTTYVERNAELCRLARHNLPLVGLSQANVVCAEAEAFLNPHSSLITPQSSFINHQSSLLTPQSSLLNHHSSLLNPQSSFITHQSSIILLDPARRDTAGRKVARIEDCTPDVCALQDQLRSRARYILIKLSPMLDITAALRALQGVVEVHVVCLDGECKELLLVMAGKQAAAQQLSIEDTPIYCVDAGQSQHELIFTLREERKAHPLPLPGEGSPFEKDCPTEHPSPGRGRGWAFRGWASYLYEPDASIMKAGAFKTVCHRFPVQKLAPDTHLYVSDELISHFPGRSWRVLDHSSFSKHDLKRLIGGLSAADLTVRGFPTSVASLRKQLHLREGGTAHFIATTLADGQRILLKVERL